MRGLVFGWVMMVGCAPDGSDSGDDSPVTTDTGTPELCEASLQIGTGVDSFLALNDGDPVTIVYGPQGGWHVETAGQVRGLTEGVQVLAALTDLRTETPISGLAKQDPEAVALEAWDGCGGSFTGVRSVIDDYVPATGTLLAFICALDGAPLRLDVSVKPLDTVPTAPTTTDVGRQAVPPPPAELAGSVNVIAVADPYFDQYFCQ